MARSYLAGKKSEFSEGSRKVLSCDGTEIGVFMIGGELVAWHNECPHRFGPVCQGRIYKRVLEPLDAEGQTRALAFDEETTNIVCTWHGYEFNLRTGVNQGSDKIKLKRAKLEERDGDVYIVL
ncbi:MAG: Rieske (2Fe-2S) protein [Beijerinckiaceae bacterium]